MSKQCLQYAETGLNSFLLFQPCSTAGSGPQAHNTHTEIIVAEAKGEKSEYSVLLSHAQDTLMNTILAETLIEELIEVYKNK